jgi:hypothetical protein
VVMVGKILAKSGSEDLPWSDKVSEKLQPALSCGAND